MPCSHVTYAFASTSNSPSKFNIASMVTQMHMQRVGSDPFLTFDANAHLKYEYHHLLTWNQFFASNANAHAYVTYFYKALKPIHTERKR